MYSLNNLNIEQFISQYWQKKPLVIKQGFTHFIDPIDEHDLAGLSQESSVDSRIVSHHDKQWQVNHGPFDDINAHCVGAWSLLVQSVDHFIDEADQLMRAFDFIPHWRMDDLMVSFSNKDAGVGPHLDQYDVFIIQGKGSRRWQVGLPASFETVNPHKDLSQISGFDAVIDQVLLPGDIIYIPAGHPHNGIAQEECLNYSVGFRAPSQQEILSSLADFAIDNNLFTTRYKDKDILPREFSGEIKQQEIAHFKDLLQQVLETDHFTSWAAQFLSQGNETQALEQQDSEHFMTTEIAEKWQGGVPFIRTPGVKAVFVEQQVTDTADFTFYINTEAFSVPPTSQNLVVNFLDSDVFSIENFPNAKNSMFFTQLLTTLVNSGYWYPED